MTSPMSSTPLTAVEPGADLRAVEALARARSAIVEQIEKRVVGQREVVEHLLIALFSRGHCLFVGVPGLAKTLLISTLAEVLNLTFNRVQFTPDLMPSDITGTDILEEDKATGRREFRFVRGPLFANIILADEVNRTPPKTQAALLEAMEERQVSVAGTADLDVARAAVRAVQAAPEVLGYIVDLARATRSSPSLSLGASPRGATALLATAKAWAWLSGRDYVTPDDVKALARPTLRHRVAVRPEAEMEGVTADGVLESVLASVPVPR